MSLRKPVSIDKTLEQPVLKENPQKNKRQEFKTGIARASPSRRKELAGPGDTHKEAPSIHRHSQQNPEQAAKKVKENERG